MRTLLLALAALLVAVHPVSAKEPEVGEAAPDFRARLFDGTKTTLTDYKGKVLLINRWATWCGPCKAEMPMMSKLHEFYKKNGFVIIGALTRDSLPKKSLTEVNAALSYPLATGLTGYGSEARSVPMSYIIDRKGIVRHIKVGSFQAQELIDLVVPLLKEPA